MPEAFSPEKKIEKASFRKPLKTTPDMIPENNIKGMDK